MLPNYAIRYSKRAKHVRLTIKPQKGLEVVLPMGASADCIPTFIRQKQAWINKHLKKQAEQTEQIKPCLPQKINLQSFDLVINIEYQPSHQKNVGVTKKGNAWLVNGNTKDENLVQKALVEAVKQQAKYHLIQRLNYWADKTNLPYKKLTIRAQKTRWGSCSSLANINLNYKLMFMPKAYVDYVIVHELTHTKHMNHSLAFWQTLNSLLPNSDDIDKKMKNANQYLPNWLDYPFT